MNIEQYHNYCIQKPGVTEGFPFDNRTLVFKVMGKMFALTDVEDFDYINLKCDPERSEELRASYLGITAGYHMSKVHWNSVTTDGTVEDPLLLELIDHSYTLIVASLPKKLQVELEGLSK